MSKDQNIGSIVASGWRIAISFWQIWILLLLVNLTFTKILLAPFNSFITSVSANRITPSTVSLTYIYDLIQSDEHLITQLLCTLPPILGIYVIWTIFSTAGIVNCVNSKDSRLSTFLFGGLNYFFRYLRLTIYMLLILGVLGFSSYTIFILGEINVFQIESEDFLITRAIWVTIGISLIYTLLKLWNDWLKITIVRQDPRFFFRQAINVVKQILNIKTLGVFLVNILITLVMIVLLRTIGQTVPNAAIIITQVIIIVRLWYKIANLSSLSNLNSALSRT